MYNLVHVCPAYMCMYISVTLPHCHFNIHVCVKKDGWCLHTTHEFTCLDHSVLTTMPHPLDTPTLHSDSSCKRWVWFRFGICYEGGQGSHLYSTGCAYDLVFNPFSPLPTAGMDFAQTELLVKDRHLLQRQMSSTGKRNHYYCNKTSLIRTPLGQKKVS